MPIFANIFVQVTCGDSNGLILRKKLLLLELKDEIPLIVCLRGWRQLIMLNCRNCSQPYQRFVIFKLQCISNYSLYL